MADPLQSEQADKSIFCVIIYLLWVIDKNFSPKTSAGNSFEEASNSSNFFILF